MFKKMMLLASTALAAVAFAVPASASALEWTDNGSAFPGTASDTLSGLITFGNPAPGQIKFSCVVHAGFSVTGGTTTGSLSSYTVTTETCVGGGSLANCTAVADSATVPAGTAIHITGTNSATVTAPVHSAEEEEGVVTPIVVHYVFNGACPIEKITLTITDLSLSTTNSNLTDATVSGLALSHTWIRELGETTQTVAVFGTMGTATDTISIS
jgi:hypothetical protein